MIKIILTIFMFFIILDISAQKNYFVNQQNGSDFNDGLSSSNPFETVENAVVSLKPKDTLFIMGEYSNESYNPNYSYSGNINDPYIWTQENTIKISNLNGKPGEYITIKSYDSNTVLKGDGANIFRITNSSFLRIEGLELYGQVEKISLETALALQFLYRESGSSNTLYRVPPGTSDEDVEKMTFPKLDNIKRPSYSDTRGIYFSNVHHIDLINNKIHHVPGSGFRIADGEYINIIRNEIHNTSRKSYSGTHALVVTKTKSTSNDTGYIINILRNKVHHNYNEIYSWAPSKTFITPRIDEGKGISLQRNNVDSWVNGKGRILVENNLCYWNGFSGVHSNDGYRIDFVNNTSFMNSYTNSVTYKNKEQKGGNIGISSQRGNDIKMVNNIVVIDTDWNGNALAASNSKGLLVRNNLIFGFGSNPVGIGGDIEAVDVNTYIGNPMFSDAPFVYNDANYDFKFDLHENSPAIGKADVNYAPEKDYYGNNRGINPGIGAIEYNASLGINENFVKDRFLVYPNPVSEDLFVKGNDNLKLIELYTITGQRIKTINNPNQNLRIDLSDVKSGIYFLKINKEIRIILKE